MKLHQLRYLCEIARRGLSFSSAAAALHTSQPGISKQIRLLEEELGVDLFIRSGNRIVEMTEPGRRIAGIATVILRELDDVRSAAREFTEGDAGRLNIATTFTFARYILPGVFRRFVSRYPKVEVNLLQGSPVHVSRLAAAGEADVAVTTRPAEDFPDLLFLEYRKLPRVLVVPRAHPLAREQRLTLKAISSYPLITLDVSSHGQSQMREVFARSGLAPHVVFSGVDVDVVKAFVEAGLGIAILPRVTFEPGREPKLRALDVSHLFESHAGCLALRKNHYLRGFVYDFIQMLAPGMGRRTVQRAQDAVRAAAH
jgi:LysR family transcriptional regulator, cys regulon transcriptional activator